MLAQTVITNISLIMIVLTFFFVLHAETHQQNTYDYNKQIIKLKLFFLKLRSCSQPKEITHQ